MADDPKVKLVRLLINDVGPNDQLFADPEVLQFLDLEGGNVKLAAAQMLDTIASNEAMVAKVIRTSDGKQTDGAKVAEAIRAHAKELRQQANDTDADDGFYADVIEFADPLTAPPELTEWPA